MAQLLKGKEVVASIDEGTRSRIAALRDAGVTPTLAIVRVGARPDDLSYERSLKRRAEALGIDVCVITLPDDCGQAELLDAIARVNADERIHGCLMFRPLPAHIDEARVCDALASEKDVDGISRASLAGLFVGDESVFPPSTAEACVRALQHFGVEVAGKHVVVVGRSLVIGRPVSTMLLARDATVTTCHSKTNDLPGLMRAADIVVCATGRARAFGADCFAPGQVVLDVGVNFDEEGSMCGDVDFATVEPVVAAITPVPGGLGSVTTALTMEHVVRAAERASARV